MAEIKKSAEETELTDPHLRQLRDSVLAEIGEKKKSKLPAAIAKVIPTPKVALKAKKSVAKHEHHATSDGKTQSIIDMKHQAESKPLTIVEAKQVPPPLHLPTVAKSGWRSLIWGLVAALVIVIVAGLIVEIVGVYKYNFDNKISNVVVKIIPLPAAKINGQIIWLADYLSDVKTLTRFYSKQASSNGAAMPLANEIKLNVLDRLKRNIILEQLAKEKKVTTSEADLAAEVTKVVEQAGSEEKVKEILKDLYGWQISDFKEKVLRPYLLQQKIQEALNQDLTLNAAKLTKAQEVLAKVKAGKEKFEDLAKQYSEDTTAAAGGELGWFGRGAMIKEFEEAAFALAKGEFSDIVKTVYGYHIIKVEDKRLDKDTNQEQIFARHILIRLVNVESLLQDKLNSAKYKLYLTVK